MAQTPPPTDMRGLLGPLWPRIRLTRGLACLGAITGTAPFIAVAELAQLLLQDPVSRDTVWLVVACCIAALALSLLCTLAAGAVANLADIDLQQRLIPELIAHTQRLPLGWFLTRGSSDVRSRIFDDVTALHDRIVHGYADKTAALTAPVVILAYLLWCDWRMALVAMLAPTVGLMLYLWQFRGFRDEMAGYQQGLADLDVAATEYVEGIAVIKVFGQQAATYSRFQTGAEKFLSGFERWIGRLAAISAVTEVILSPFFALCLMLSFGTVLVSLDQMAAVYIIPFVVMAPALTAPFVKLSFAQKDVMLSDQAAANLCDLLATDPLSSPAQPVHLPDATLRFEGVSFAYDTDQTALCDIDVTLPAGSVTALVGQSGSGKSTVARLVPRFWDPTAGRITLGGVDLRKLPVEQLYDQVGFVFQDANLACVSIADNIRSGHNKADRQRVINSARAAEIHDEIMALPRGYDSIIGEDIQLSRGQAQRIAIARVLFKDPPVMVFDEVTEYMDANKERKLLDALARAAEGRTVLAIAHRLQTVTHADQLCVLEGGRLVQQGTHDALVGAPGPYAELWRQAHDLQRRVT